MKQAKKQKVISHFMIVLFALVFAIFGAGDWSFKAIVSGFMIFLSLLLFFILMDKVKPYKSLLIMSPIFGFLASVSVFFMEQSYDFKKAIIAGLSIFITIWVLMLSLFVIVSIHKVTKKLFDKEL